MHMLLEIVFKELNTSVVVNLEKSVEEVRRALPFTSTVDVWKQEIYFPTPIDISYANKDLAYKARIGSVHWWPPQKALCIFYGLSHQYTPTVELGDLVDPVNVLFDIESGVAVDVIEHKREPSLAKFGEVLERRGFTWSTPLRNGKRVLVAYKIAKGKRISVEGSVEPYGIYIESEGIAEFSTDLASIRELSILREVSSRHRYARIDLAENGLIVVSACSRHDEEELEKAVEDVEELLKNLI
uniref:Cyclophilin TM1367-like domain-containing protein n=1 Tax=Ignisphaera aggregans TaxID=334771 RepID=A0A7C4BBW9_9CREN